MVEVKEEVLVGVVRQIMEKGQLEDLVEEPLVMIQQVAQELEQEQVDKDIQEEMQEEVTTLVVVEVLEEQGLVVLVLQFLMEVPEFNILLLVLFIGLVVAVDLAIQTMEVMAELEAVVEVL